MGRSLAVRWLIFAGCMSALYAGYTVWRVHRLQELSAQEAVARQQSEESTSPSLLDAGKKPKAKPTPPAEFTLTDQDGQPFSSESLKGRVWVGSYFFTNCPAVCWRLNQLLAGWQETHPDSPVRFVSITCDPENDPPEVLVRYAKRFNADPKRWTFLTGDMETIARLGKDSFLVTVEKGTHSDRAFVVDRQGQVRGRFRVTEPDQFEKLRLLLAQLEAEGPAETAAAPAAVAPPAEAGAAPTAPVGSAAPRAPTDSAGGSAE